MSVILVKNLLPADSHQYSHAQWVTELPTFAEKGSDIGLFVKAEKEFKNQNYKSAISLFDEIDTLSKYYPYSLMYIGASHDMLNENQKAIESFDKLIGLKVKGESSKGLWYKALVQLEEGETNNAIATLKLLSEDEESEYFDEAKELLSNLE